MNLPSDKAFALLRRWKDNATRVIVAFTGVNPAKLVGQIDGHVMVVEPDKLVAIGSTSNCSVQFDPSGCIFEVLTVDGDPASEADTEAVLAIIFPTKERCMVNAFVRPN
jgi:hypothetical protein